MIRMTFHLNGRVQKFQHETLDSLWKQLDELCPTGGEVVLRLVDDETLFRNGKFRVDREQAADRSAGRVRGTPFPFWALAMTLADGDGWRIFLAGARKLAEAQPQPGPPMGRGPLFGVPR